MHECSANRSVFPPPLVEVSEGVSRESGEVAEAPGTGGKTRRRRSQYPELQPEVWWNRNGTELPGLSGSWLLNIPTYVLTYCEPRIAHKVQVGRQTHPQLHSSAQVEFCSRNGEGTVIFGACRGRRHHKALLDGSGPSCTERKAQGTECAKAGNVRYPGWLEFQIGVSNGGDEAGEHQRPLTVSLELDPSPGG